jgi:hypothetical protein
VDRAYCAAFGFECLCRPFSDDLTLDREVFAQGGIVSIPADLLKLLLQIALAAVEFDADDYLKTVPDVAGAAEQDAVDRAHLHFMGYGRFEGPQGCGTRNATLQNIVTSPTSDQIAGRAILPYWRSRRAQPQSGAGRQRGPMEEGLRPSVRLAHFELGRRRTTKW